VGHSLAPWKNTMWENDQVTAINLLSENLENCLRFTRATRGKADTYKFKIDDCFQKRPVICKKKPTEYLSVSTELLLITDGRSNDPKKFGYKLKKMKEKFNDVGVDVAAIGVGRINQNEIRDLTDDRPGQILYLMSWQSVNTFNAILTKLLHANKYSADNCLPLEVDRNDLVWQKWYQVMLEEGINVNALNKNGNTQMGRTISVGQMSSFADPNGHRTKQPYKEPVAINLNNWGIDNEKVGQDMGPGEPDGDGDEVEEVEVDVEYEIPRGGSRGPSRGEPSMMDGSNMENSFDSGILNNLFGGLRG